MSLLMLFRPRVVPQPDYAPIEAALTTADDRITRIEVANPKIAAADRALLEVSRELLDLLRVVADRTA